MLKNVLAAILCLFVNNAVGQENAVSDTNSTLQPFSVELMAPPAASLDMRAIFNGPRGDSLPPVRLQNGRFVAGGKRVRFWGVNLCFAGCFPTHEAADLLAAKLAGYGINCIRFHHMDMQAFPRGIWNKDFTGLDSEALDRLDYFLAALKREGVYANLNLHVSRDFSKTGSGYDHESLPAHGKQACLIDLELIQLQKRYASDLLGHVNPYTKLRYADDPVVALVEISNENSIFLSLSKFARNELPAQFERQLVDGWNKFLFEKYANTESLAAAWADDDKKVKLQPVPLQDQTIARLRRADISSGQRGEDYIEFLTHVDMRFFTEMRGYLRDDLGVKCPITGTEGFTLPSDYVQSHLDYVDSHEYWQHPEFGGDGWNRVNWSIPNTAMVDEPTDKSILLLLTFQRMLNPDGSGEQMPFTVSEYNHCAPNDYQAEAIPMVSAFAAAQDWDGVFLFTYKHDSRWDRDYVDSYFDIHANPVKMVQLIAGTLQFRRGDIEPLGSQVITHIPAQNMYELSATHLPWTAEIQKSVSLDAPAAKRFYGRYAIAPYSSDTEAESPTVVIPPISGTPWEQPNSGLMMVTSDSSLKWTSDGPQTGCFAAKGERSKSWVGFKASQAKADNDGFSVSLKSPQFAAVTFSSLDGKTLENSKRILITACSRTENTNQIWNETRTSVNNNWGQGPTLIEPVVAEARLPHGASKATLTALGGDGSILQKWTIDSADEIFTIDLGQGPATLWYLLECE